MHESRCLAKFSDTLGSTSEIYLGTWVYTLPNIPCNTSLSSTLKCIKSPVPFVSPILIFFNSHGREMLSLVKNSLKW